VARTESWAWKLARYLVVEARGSGCGLNPVGHMWAGEAQLKWDAEIEEDLNLGDTRDVREQDPRMIQQDRVRCWVSVAEVIQIPALPKETLAHQKQHGEM
jgi:hypothetical protein